jgi:hypothetical protein
MPAKKPVKNAFIKLVSPIMLELVFYLFSGGLNEVQPLQQGDASLGRMQLLPPPGVQVLRKERQENNQDSSPYDLQGLLDGHEEEKAVQERLN